MPKLIINERDNTTPGIREYSNFTVVVPGLVSTESGIDLSVFNEDGIYECETQKAFKKHIGKVEPKPDEGYGNQIAYELLGVGYKVIYKKIDLAEESGNDTAAEVLAKPGFWEPLKDKATYDFRYVITGLTTSNAGANNAISELCKYVNGKSYLESGRGDAIALLDIDTEAYLKDAGTPKTQAETIKGIIEESTSLDEADTFSAIFAPMVTYEGAGDPDYDNNRTFPASFHYLVCAAEAFQTYPEGFAVAGYTRGKSNKFKVAKTSVILGEAAIDALEPRVQKTYEDTTISKAINVVAKIKGTYYLWGNRTAHALGTADTNDGDLVASHFLNIRQLCTTIKKQLYINCRRFTFEPNSDVLWVNFCNAIEPTLERMKANQGITDYQIIKRRDPRKAVLSAIIRIVPIEAVEDFEIDLTLEDSIEGATVIIGE